MIPSCTASNFSVSVRGKGSLRTARTYQSRRNVNAICLHDRKYIKPALGWHAEWLPPKHMRRVDHERPILTNRTPRGVSVPCRGSLERGVPRLIAREIDKGCHQ
jgi:hypothetical protein